MNSSSFKVFNILQIALFFVFALITFISAVYWIVSIFNISALLVVRDFIATNLYCFVLGIGLEAGQSLSSLSFGTTQIINAILLCFSLLFFIWTLITAIRLINVKEYNQAFRGGVLTVNIVFSLILIYNAFLIITKYGIATNTTALIAFIIDALFVLLTILNICVNSVGKKSLNKDEMDDAEKLANANISAQGEMYTQPRMQTPPRQMPPRPNPMMQQNQARPTQTSGQTPQRAVPPRPPVPPKRPTPPKN